MNPALNLTNLAAPPPGVPTPVQTLNLAGLLGLSTLAASAGLWLRHPQK